MNVSKVIDVHDGVVDPVPQVGNVVLILNGAAETESLGQSSVATRARAENVDLLVSRANASRALSVSPIQQ